MRAVHKFYANMNGYFWLPCPICKQEFGGHEWLPVTDGLESSIPDPSYPGDGSRGVGICPDCTRAGKGTEAWDEWIKQNGSRWRA